MAYDGCSSFKDVDGFQAESNPRDGRSLTLATIANIHAKAWLHLPVACGNKPYLLLSPLLLILRRRHPNHLSEDPRKVIRVLIAQALADLVDVEFGGAEELTGLLHFQFLKKVHGGVTGGFLENQVQIALGEPGQTPQRRAPRKDFHPGGGVHIADHRRPHGSSYPHGILFLRL